ICVDTHVHRISNRLGWVRTRTPEQTEQALYRAVPKRHWPTVNLYLVTWGQNVCRPVYPRCRACVISDVCPKVGVERIGKQRGFTVRRLRVIAVVLALFAGASELVLAGQTKPAAAPANPVLVFDTLKGSFEIELFQTEAPKSVEHILDLMKRNFYR